MKCASTALHEQNIKQEHNTRCRKFMKMAKFYLNMMLRAPRGVTSTAGAKAYAAKLAISPRITAR